MLCRARVEFTSADADFCLDLVTEQGQIRCAQFTVFWTPTDTGVFDLVAVATDSRGRSVRATRTVTVAPIEVRASALVQTLQLEEVNGKKSVTGTVLVQILGGKPPFEVNLFDDRADHAESLTVDERSFSRPVTFSKVGTHVLTAEVLDSAEPTRRRATPIQVTFEVLDVTGAEATLGANLLVNGGADAAPSGTAGEPYPSAEEGELTGWTVVSGGPRAIVYGVPSASGGWPAPESPGPPNRGLGLFVGGFSSPSIMTQSRSLSSLDDLVDAGIVSFTLSGWLGGWKTQDDHAFLRLEFLDAARETLLEVFLGGACPGPDGVCASHRVRVTGLLKREAKGTVPAGARSLMVVLTMVLNAGTSNDGYVDELSLVLN